MPVNTGGKFNIPDEPSNMEEFDAFPPEIRGVVRNASFHASTAGINRCILAGYSSSQIQTLINEVMMESTKLTYGPDHPQAGA